MLNYKSKPIEPLISADDLAKLEMCDVCGKCSPREYIYRTRFPYKSNINVTIRHHYYCDVLGYFKSTFGIKNI